MPGWMMEEVNPNVGRPTPIATDRSSAELLELADALMQGGDVDAATRAYYDAFLALEAEDAPQAGTPQQQSVLQMQQNLMRKVNQLYLAERFPEALQLVQETIALDPGSRIGLEAQQCQGELQELLQTVDRIRMPGSQGLGQHGLMQREVRLETGAGDAPTTARVDALRKMVGAGVVPDVVGNLGNVNVAEAARAGMGLSTQAIRPLGPQQPVTPQATIKLAGNQEVSDDYEGALNTYIEVLSDPKSSTEAKRFAQKRIADISPLIETLETRVRGGG